MILRMAALVMALATPAWATVDGWPALYDVAGVDPADVLNVRLGPSTAADVIATLAPDATGIEVLSVSEDEGWGRINAGEATGWVSLAFLARRPGQWAGQPPQDARCFGTEPFWSLSTDDDGATFRTPEALPLDFMLRSQLRSRNRIDRHVGVYENDLGGLVGTWRNATCSDGMSDRAYGWEIDLLLAVAGADNAQLYSGCCTIAPE